LPGFIVESPVWRLELEAHTQEDLERITDDIADDARRACPRDTDELAESITTVYEPGVGYVYVGTDHWAPTEYGSADHEITPRRPGGALRFFWLKAGRLVILSRVHHPGTPAQPFMRPALYRRRKPRGVVV